MFKKKGIFKNYEENKIGYNYCERNRMDIYICNNIMFYRYIYMYILNKKIISKLFSYIFKKKINYDQYSNKMRRLKNIYTIYIFIYI